MAALGLVLVLGAVFAPTFGQSTDEYSDFEYAANSLRAYVGGPLPVGPSFEELHGPFHLELTQLFATAVVSLPLGWTPTDARHLANLAAFSLGLAGIYSLCRRNLSVRGSLIATCLFGTQPLLVGQAFINEKDAPFLAFFILTIAVGLATADRLVWPMIHAAQPPIGARRRAPHGSSAGLLSELRARTRLRGLVVSGCLLLLALAGASLLFGWFFLPAAKSLLAQAYAGQALGPIQALFNRIATDAYKTPLAAYMAKTDQVYAWLKVVLAGAVLALELRLMRAWLPGLWRQGTSWMPVGLGRFAAAGAVLGLTNSIRVAAPLAGALVGGYLLWQHGRRAWLPLAAYGVAATAATYLTWPFLWASPVAGYVESLRVMADFPSHSVLFGGSLLASTDIPWDYVPRLIALQTTEIVVPLFLAGLAVWIVRALRSRLSWVDLVLWLLWLGVPIGLVIGLGSPLYGNLRQMLFCLPPLFLIAGAAIEAILNRLAGRLGRAGLVGLILFPGLAGIFALHPYEDSYFNAWVGWTSGAYGKYQVDPWCTAYREATQHLNGLAPSGASVDVRGPFQSAQDFARPDLEMHPDFAPASTPDFALMCQIDLQGNGFKGDLPIAYEVRRGRAVLAVLRGPR